MLVYNEQILDLLGPKKDKHGLVVKKDKNGMARTPRTTSLLSNLPSSLPSKTKSFLISWILVVPSGLLSGIDGGGMPDTRVTPGMLEEGREQPARRLHKDECRVLAEPPDHLDSDRVDRPQDWVTLPTAYSCNPYG